MRAMGLRYESDLTEAEWTFIAPLMPPARDVRRPRTSDLREAVRCADEIQQEIEVHNADLPEDRHMWIYIWSNLAI